MPDIRQLTDVSHCNLHQDLQRNVLNISAIRLTAAEEPANAMTRRLLRSRVCHTSIIDVLVILGLAHGKADP